MIPKEALNRRLSRWTQLTRNKYQRKVIKKEPNRHTDKLITTLNQSIIMLQESYKTSWDLKTCKYNDLQYNHNDSKT